MKAFYTILAANWAEWEEMCDKMCDKMNGERGTGQQPLERDTNMDPQAMHSQARFLEVSTWGDRGMAWPEQQGMAAEASAKSVNLQRI